MPNPDVFGHTVVLKLVCGLLSKPRNPFLVGLRVQKYSLLDAFGKAYIFLSKKFFIRKYLWTTSFSFYIKFKLFWVRFLVPIPLNGTKTRFYAVLDSNLRCYVWMLWFSCDRKHFDSRILVDDNIISQCQWSFISLKHRRT